MFTNSPSLVGVPFSWLEASVLPDPLTSPVRLSARGGLQKKKGRGNERMVKNMHVMSTPCCSHAAFFKFQTSHGVPECSNGGEIVVDVKHGGIQQCVDVLEALQSCLQTTAAFLLQLPQFFLRHCGQRRWRRRHGGH